MEKYLTEMLHMDTKLVEATELYDHLPLLFKGTYVIYKVNSGGVEWIAWSNDKVSSSLTK